MISTIVTTVAPLWIIVHVLLGIIAGLAVYTDADQRPGTVFKLHPIWWGLITMASPILGIAVYWVIHYSTLVATKSEDG